MISLKILVVLGVALGLSASNVERASSESTVAAVVENDVKALAGADTAVPNMAADPQKCYVSGGSNPVSKTAGACTATFTHTFTHGTCNCGTQTTPCTFKVTLAWLAGGQNCAAALCTLQGCPIAILVPGLPTLVGALDCNKSGTNTYCVADLGGVPVQRLIGVNGTCEECD